MVSRLGNKLESLFVSFSNFLRMLALELGPRLLSPIPTCVEHFIFIEASLDRKLVKSRSHQNLAM